MSTQSAPAFTFTSHVAGRNARVSVYPSHIDWQSAPAIGVNIILVLLACCTIALSLLIRPLRPRLRGTSNSIPMKAVSAVRTQPSRTQSKIEIVSSGTTIEGRVAPEEAEAIKGYILERIS